MKEDITKLSIAAMRSLVIDTINKANSGHPGMALGSAPIMYTLFTRHLVGDPTHPEFFNRDRFVLSAGHASSLLYVTLHLSGYQISMDDLKAFRQVDSLTPGHPEYHWTPGVDATSGPLGQGIAQAVGMAIAEQSIAANYPEGKRLSDHYTYVLCGDGCLQEGISQEAISFAGHQKLNKLILFYDANNVTLDGGLDLSFSEDVKKRFEASAWNVLEVMDGNDVEAIDKAIITAKKSDKPTLILVHTIIGYGSAKQGTSKVHGSPLGKEDGEHAKKEIYGFDHEDFFVPLEVYEHFKETFIKRGQKAYALYLEELKKYQHDHPDYYLRFNELSGSLSLEGYLPKTFPEFEEGMQISTRNASGKALNDYVLSIPNLIGGSADVAGSVITKLNEGINFMPNTREGHNFNWGIREFLMSSAQNGILLHGGLRTYVGCFLVFSDYMKAAIRMAALSHLPAIYLFSHDSLAVGEDGPTHQPIEQLAMLRSIPNMHVIRPCDIRETYAAWYLALASTKTPTALILSRQNLPVLKGSDSKKALRGAYVFAKEEKEAELVFIATGSEVSLAVEAKEMLAKEGIDVRVVSMPSMEIFGEQDEEYQKEVLLLDYDHRISVEMLSTFGWAKYARYQMGVDTFGASGPAKDVIDKFNFTSERLVKLAKDILGR